MQRMRKRWVLYTVILILIFFAGILIDTTATLISNRHCTLRVHKDEGWTRILKDFDKHGCPTGLGLTFAAKSGLLERALGIPMQGTVRCDTTFIRCLVQIAHPVMVSLTIIPGRDVWQNGRDIARQLGLPDSEVLPLLKDKGLARSFGIPLNQDSKVYSPFEGFLAPDTYKFFPGTAPREVLKVLVKEQLNRLKRHPCTLKPYQCITLASIVEKESADPDDMRKVARVLLNRLKKGMPLQSDPTMLYGPSGLAKKTTLQLKKDSSNPYNTYTHTGLPPGPICSPGLSAIKAVSNPYNGPDASRLLYFVSKRDGTHHFSTTYKEHLKAVRRFLKQKKR